MNRQVAEKLLQGLTECAKSLDSAEEFARSIDDETAQADFRRAIATVGGILSLVVMIALVKHFSEGDWMDAVMTTFVARGMVLAVVLMW